MFGKEPMAIHHRVFGEAIAKMILSLNSKSDYNEQRSRDEGWVIKAKDYIAANYHRRLKVEHIAEALHIDRQYLRNLFVKYEGVPTKEYLDGYRMAKAAELLNLEGANVYIVSLSVGYSDALAFSKAFKKYYDMAPSIYAKQQRDQ